MRWLLSLLLFLPSSCLFSTEDFKMILLQSGSLDRGCWRGRVMPTPGGEPPPASLPSGPPASLGWKEQGSPVACSQPCRGNVSPTGRGFYPPPASARTPSAEPNGVHRALPQPRPGPQPGRPRRGSWFPCVILGLGAPASALAVCRLAPLPLRRHLDPILGPDFVPPCLPSWRSLKIHFSSF